MLREANLTDRALIAALGVCLAAPVTAAAQGSLPAPPYAAQAGAPGYGAQAKTQAAPLYDRYGGGAVHAPIARPVSAAPAYAQAYNGPHLAWSGKTVEAPAPAAQPRSAYAAYAPRAFGAQTSAVPARAHLQYPSMATAAPTSASAEPPAVETTAPPAYTPPVRKASRVWQAPPAPASTAAPAVVPASIYDPAPPVAVAATAEPAMPPPPVRTAANATGEGPRLYSLHRDYGMQPDPIPLAPQFFGPTADLTAPETPEVGHRTKTASGAYVNAPTDAPASE